MKKITLTLFAALMFVATAFTASAQKEESRSVSGFHSISSGGAFDVHVKIDGSESLKITGEASVIDQIETKVENGNLSIRFKEDHDWNNNNNEKINIYISAKSLSALQLGGSGKITVDGELTGERVKLSVGGSGNITTAIKSTDVQASVGGSGSLHLSGTADDAGISIGGSGTINAKDLKLSTVHVSIGGSGRASVYADKTINASVSGSGHVTYSGNATVNEVNSRRSSRISRADR